LRYLEKLAQNNKIKSNGGKKMVDREGMSTEEAGRKGGLATSRKHGPEFYSEIGRKGGRATSRSHGKEFYQEIGKRGGSRSRRGSSNGMMEM
jgi:general stress protein YciG